MLPTNIISSPYASDSNVSNTWSGEYLGVVGLFVLLGFTWLPNSYVVMAAWPYALLWQGAFSALIVWTIWMCRQSSIALRPLGYGLDWVIALVAAVSACSALSSNFKAVAFWNLGLIFSYCVVLYLLINWIRQGSLTRHRLWLWLSITGVVTSIVSLLGWRPNSDMWLSNNFYDAIRNSFPLGHHNFVGGYELLLLPIVLSFSLTQKGWKKWCWITSSFLVVVALYASGSRGALLGLFSLGLIAVPASFIYFKRRKSQRRWLIGAICFFFVMLIAIAGNPRVRTLVSTPLSASNETEISIDALEDGPVKDRLLMLKTSQNVLKNRPLLGVGPGNLSRNYNLYRPIEAGSGVALVQQLHNTPAQILAELGLLGFSAYIALIGCLLKIGFSLHKAIKRAEDRFLLYGIGASWFGYSVSSLTDYQIENIGIAITLTASVVLLISLADIYQPRAYPTPFSRRMRRIFSLVLLVFMCLSAQLWITSDMGLSLSNSARRSFEARDFAEADRKWYAASQRVPWDPTYAGLAAEQVLDLLETTESEEARIGLTQDAIKYLEQALQAAPYDTWFNQNLATLLLPVDSKQAEKYISKTVLAYPRNTHFTYYTLALAYLEQDKTDKAIAALALESIANPRFLTANVWNSESLKPLLNPVLDTVFNAQTKILSRTNQGLSQYSWLSNQLSMLSWWFRYPLEIKNTDKLSPVVQAVLKSEQDPSAALLIVNQQIAKGDDSEALLLLRAWLSPNEYLDEFLAQSKGTVQDKSNVEKNIRVNRDIRSWLKSVFIPPIRSRRLSLTFAYRNIYANAIQRVLYPDDFEANLLVHTLGLLSPAPREFSQLDYQMDELRTESLGLVLPINNGFELFPTEAPHDSNN